MVADSNGRILLTNEKMESFFGYSRKEFLGKSIEMVVPARFREIHLEHRARFNAAPSRRQMGTDREVTALRKDGSEFPVLVTLIPLPSETDPWISAVIQEKNG